MRSPWKGKFFDQRMYRLSMFSVKSLAKLRGRSARKRVLRYFWVKNSTVPKFLRKKRIAVYNGFLFHSFIVRPYMVQRRIGEFVLTKLIGTSIHRRKKRKKVQKKKAW